VTSGSIAGMERRLFPRAPRRLPADPAAAQLLRRFGEVSPFTIGVEEELLVVDAETLDPVPAAEQVLASLGFEFAFKPEFRAAQIELATPVCRTAAEVKQALADLREELRAASDPSLAFMAAGTHPRALPGQVSDRLRYRRIASEHPWASHWLLTCGLHVHVAVPGAERALAVYNALRSYLPLIAAIGANSPFYLGEESGMESVRSQLNATFPRSGVPPSFESLESYAAFVRWGAVAPVIADPSQHWWDLRLSPEYGTIEVRSADAQTQVEETGAIAALVQSLVAWLVRRYDDGEPLPVCPGERIRENAWRAARDGAQGFLVDLESGEKTLTAEVVRALVRRLMPFAAELECEGELVDVYGLLGETGAERQRRIATCAGIQGLLQWLSEAFEEREVDRRRLGSLIGRSPRQ
jgi:carboxylate-amine ligase